MNSNNAKVSADLIKLSKPLAKRHLEGDHSTVTAGVAIVEHMIVLYENKTHLGVQTYVSLLCRGVAKLMITYMYMISTKNDNK